MFVAAYQMSVRDTTRSRPRPPSSAFGHSDKTLDDIRTFIDGYDPETPDRRGDCRTAGVKE